MKTYIRWSLVFMLCLALRIPAEALIPADSPWEGSLAAGIGWLDAEAGFEAGMDWFLISKLEWPIEGVTGELEGILTYHLPTAKGDWRIGIRGKIATSGDLSGTGTDSDWDLYGAPWLYSEADTQADWEAWDVDLFLSTHPFAKAENPTLRRFSFRLGVGWGEQNLDLSDNNLRYVYDYGRDIGTVSGDVSTYDLTMEGMRIRFGTTVTLTETLNLSADVVWMPDLEATGNGHWILRDYRFTQTAKGTGTLFQLRLDAQLSPVWAAHVSLNTSDLTADEQGLESGQEAGGAPYSSLPIVRDITLSTTSVELGISARF